jgi:hypothetical protein
LFQGGLSHAAAQAAELGFGAGPHPTLRIDCDRGSWDFHAADPDTLLFAYDQRLYTLSRSLGIRADPGQPGGASPGPARSPLRRRPCLHPGGHAGPARRAERRAVPRHQRLPRRRLARRRGPASPR